MRHHPLLSVVRPFVGLVGTRFLPENNVSISPLCANPPVRSKCDSSPLSWFLRRPHPHVSCAVHALPCHCRFRHDDNPHYTSAPSFLYVPSCPRPPRLDVDTQIPHFPLATPLPPPSPSMNLSLYPAPARSRSVFVVEPRSPFSRSRNQKRRTRWKRNPKCSRRPRRRMPRGRERRGPLPPRRPPRAPCRDQRFPAAMCTRVY